MSEFNQEGISPSFTERGFPQVLLRTTTRFMLINRGPAYSFRSEPSFCLFWLPLSFLKHMAYLRCVTNTLLQHNLVSIRFFRTAQSLVVNVRNQKGKKKGCERDKLLYTWLTSYLSSDFCMCNHYCYLQKMTQNLVIASLNINDSRLSISRFLGVF